MKAQLNHTLVWSTDRTQSALFAAEMLGLWPPVRFGRFEVVELDNGVSLDFADAAGPIQAQHYGFLISAPDFDAGPGVFASEVSSTGRIRCADRPLRSTTMMAGWYFANSDNHNLEALMVPYGGRNPFVPPCHD